MMFSPRSLRRISALGAFIVVVGSCLPVAATASNEPSRFCKTSEQKCRLSSWLTARDKKFISQRGQTQEQLFHDETALDSRSAHPCGERNVGCTRSSAVQKHDRESRGSASLASSKARDTEALIDIAPPSPQIAAPDISRPTQLEGKPTATHSSPPQATVTPMGMSGPHAYNAETGDLDVNRLQEQSVIEPIRYFKTGDMGRYRLASLSNGLEMLGDRTEAADVPSRKSNWLQRLAWVDVPHITIGARVWFSQGKLGYNFASIGGPDVASELLWQGQNVPIYEVKADLVVRRFVSTLILGWGSIDKGTLRDQDFEFNSRTGIFSDTLSSPTDGNVLYGSVDLGPRLLQWRYKEGTGAFDLLVGFQYWREKWTARGVNVLLCNPAVIICALPVGASTNSNAVTETVTWHIVRLGPRFTVPLFPRVTAAGHAFYIPWTYYENKDIHHLRTDLAQDPSFLDKASGGEGIQLEAALQVRIWKALRLEGGYRYWDIRSGSGDSITFVPCTIVGGGQSSCGILAGQLNAAKARRQGIFFGLDWTF